MGINNPREFALRILNGYIKKSQSDDREDIFRGCRLDERDRAFVNNLVQGVFRQRLRLDWIIEQLSAFPLKKIDKEVLNVLRIALYQIFFMDRVPESAAVNESVNLVRAARMPRHVISFVNGLLRTACRQRGVLKFPDRERERARYLSVYHSYPLWLADKWIRELGEDNAEALMSAQNDFPGLNIRANSLRISRDALIEIFLHDGINARPLAWSPQGIAVEGHRGRPDALDAFKKGLFQVQDQAAQIASYLLSVRPGDRVLDICAGLGGKSSHLAELMAGRGQVIALDSDKVKLASLAENADRLGINNILPVEGDAGRPLSSLFEYRFKRVILDAPCSGLGVISRHPDIKWNRVKEDIPRLAATQEKFLNSAASVVEKGGKLLYVVCTISREENEGVVEGFLKTNGDFSRVDLRKRAPEWCLDLIDDKGFYRTWPHIHKMDGFFAALFRKDD
ncbi:MAG: 16S rRNA (cytosine(967)-C(5))-methyltransferase RsmB [Deltaproteobacteria bacterium]|nr:16S rRNA (cytosine(967)-C(5))-methyltransferase RsmB [Deltaproteobacteria bacterium]